MLFDCNAKRSETQTRSIWLNIGNLLLKSLQVTLVFFGSDLGFIGLIPYAAADVERALTEGGAKVRSSRGKKKAQ